MSRLWHSFEIGILVMFTGALLSRPAGAQNVTPISAPHEVTVSAAGARSVSKDSVARIAVPVGIGADLGSGDQKGVAPALGFQLWKTDHYFSVRSLQWLPLIPRSPKNMERSCSIHLSRDARFTSPATTC
jgi:hypothetical protein